MVVVVVRQRYLHTCPPQSSLRQENVTVFGCLTHEVPLSVGDAAVTCSKGEGEECGEERRLVVRSRGRCEEGGARDSRRRVGEGS